MLQKILKRITNNFGLKVLAAVIAIVIWLVIVNTEDPERTQKFTMQVEMINAEYLTEQGKTYEVLDDTDYITFTVTGQRSYVDRLTSSDFTVTADLSNIENNSQVPIQITCSRYGNYVSITSRAKYVEVYVENIVSEKIPVEVETTGTVAEGFQLSDELQANIKEVEVTGPKSVVESIQRAVAWVEIESLQADTATTTSLVFYDSEGNEVDTSRLTFDHTRVTVSIGILEQKTVPIEYHYNGTPAEGYQVVSAEGSLTSINIVGEPEAIVDVDAILVSGPEMSVSGADRTIEKVIDIRDYLPEGINLVAGQEPEIEVTIVLEQEAVRTYAMPAGNVEILNIPEGYQATIKGSSVELSIKGYPSELNAITESELKGTVDASRVTEGDQTLTVTVAGDYQVEGTVQVTVQVTKQEAVPPVEDPDAGNDS